MLNIQMKVLEPKWKQEQRRSLQNTANKYAKRSSRTFICCLSTELKSRYRISQILKNRRIKSPTTQSCCPQSHRIFSSAGICQILTSKETQGSKTNHLSRWIQTPKTKLSGEMVIAKTTPSQKVRTIPADDICDLKGLSVIMDIELETPTHQLHTMQNAPTTRDMKCSHRGRCNAK